MKHIQSISDAAAIPTLLRQKLLEMRPILEVQGSLQRRAERGRKPCYRIRLRDYKNSSETGFQKSINLGGDERVAAAIWVMIEGWRAEREKSAAEEAENVREKRTLNRWARCAKITRSNGVRGRPRNARLW